MSRGGIDERGASYGELRVVSGPTTCDGVRGLLWLCACSCGRLARVRGNNLRNGGTRSCGHLQYVQRPGTRTSPSQRRVNAQYKGIVFNVKNDELLSMAVEDFDLDDYLQGGRLLHEYDVADPPRADNDWRARCYDARSDG